MKAKLLFLFLLLVFSAYAFRVVDNCGYGDKLNKYAEEVYNSYCKIGTCPSLHPNFYIEAKKLDNYAGLAYFSASGAGASVYKIEIACGLDDFQLQKVVAHEFAHALQAAYLRDFSQFDGWFVEASAEGLAVLYMQNKSGIPWFQFWFPHSYYSERLYKVNPFSVPLRTNKNYEYKYSGAVAWLLERYGIRNIFPFYSYPNITFIKESYINFLISPWQWPYKPEFESILLINTSMIPYTGIYAYEFRDYIYEPGELLVMANAPLNATLSNYLYIAFAPTSSGTLSYTITVRPCKNVTTITQTITTTTTVTKTKTETITTTVPITTTVTVPVTTTITSLTTTTTTITVPITTTTTVTKVITETVPVTTTITATETETITTTVPITTTISIPVTTTVTETETITTTIPVTVTERSTVTETVTTTSIYTTVVTSTESLIILLIAIILIIIAILLCRKQTEG